jgi:membrane fusion protein, copper/silver efflux system
LATWSRRAGEAVAAASTPVLAEPQKRILYWYDPMHPAYHSEKPGIAPDCGMALVPMYESKSSGRAGHADRRNLIHLPQSQQRALGVRLATVEEQEMSRTLRTSGVVAADEREHRHVHVKTSGWVEDVYANFVGQLVKQGPAAVHLLQPGPGGDAAGVSDCAPRPAAARQLAL